MSSTDAPTEVVGRFAPSPSGRMHAGNIFAALVAWLLAKSADGRIVLRIEDLDSDRSKREYVDAVMRDFEFLGLTWDGEPLFQNGRAHAYQDAYATICQKYRVYPCWCTRADIQSASAPHDGEKAIYPGTCRHLDDTERARLMSVRKPAWRIQVPPMDICFDDKLQGRYAESLMRDCGDFILRRSDGAFAYQLAVVVDDACQGVNQVVRGCDLLSSTPQQIFLQRALGYPQPEYAHVPLLVSDDFRRLSKRDHDAGIEELKSEYDNAEGIIGHIAGVTGLTPTTDPIGAEELLKHFDVESLRRRYQILWR